MKSNIPRPFPKTLSNSPLPLSFIFGFLKLVSPRKKARKKEKRPKEIKRTIGSFPIWVGIISITLARSFTTAYHRCMIPVFCPLERQPTTHTIFLLPPNHGRCSLASKSCCHTAIILLVSGVDVAEVVFLEIG